MCRLKLTSRQAFWYNEFVISHVNACVIDLLFYGSLHLTCHCCSVQMGGRNTVLLDAISWRIPLVSDVPTITFGADVTHPETGEDSSPSIAAVLICYSSCRMKLMSNTACYNKLFYDLANKSILAGCCISRLAWSHKVCWTSLCSGSSTGAHTGSL